MKGDAKFPHCVGNCALYTSLIILQSPVAGELVIVPFASCRYEPVAFEKYPPLCWSIVLSYTPVAFLKYVFFWNVLACTNNGWEKTTNE